MLFYPGSRWLYTSTPVFYPALLNLPYSLIISLEVLNGFHKQTFFWINLYILMSCSPYTSLETHHGNTRNEVKGDNLVGMFFLWRRTVQRSAEVECFYLGPNHWRQCSRLLQQSGLRGLVKFNIHIAEWAVHMNTFENLFNTMKGDTCQLNAPIIKITQPKRVFQDWGWSFVFWNRSSFWNFTGNTTPKWQCSVASIAKK